MSEMEGDGLMEVAVLEIPTCVEPVESRGEHEHILDCSQGAAAGDGLAGSSEREVRGSDPTTKTLQPEDPPAASESEGLPHKKIPAGERLKAYRRGGKFICKGCGKNFRLQSHCIAHERIHTGEKPFACQRCGTSFRWRSQWKNHQTRICKLPFQNIHTGGGLKDVEGLSVAVPEKLEGPAMTPGRPVRVASRSVGEQMSLYNSESHKIDESTYGRGGVEQQAMLTEQRLTLTWNRSKSSVIDQERLHTEKKNHMAVKLFTSRDSGKSFQQSSQLIDQEKSDMQDLYACTECGETYSRVCDLGVHMKVHAGEQPFTCSECGHGFMTQQSLKAHQSCHAGVTGMNRSMNEELPRELDTKQESQESLSGNNVSQREETTSEDYDCEELEDPAVDEQDTTEERATDVGSLKQVVEQKMGKGVIPALDLEKHCPSKPAIADHKGIKVEDSKYTCTPTWKSSASERILAPQYENKAEGDPFICCECGESFQESAHLIAHGKVHAVDKSFTCSECGESFQWQSQWIEHQRSHPLERTVICTECGENINYTYSPEHPRMNAHENMSPDGVQHSIEYLHVLEHLKTCTSKPHSCADCGKSFKLRESLVLHQKRSHTRELPYNCQRCEMSFARRHEFRIHYKTHKGERPYVCTHCGKCFKGMLTLSKHQRSHEEELVETVAEAEGPFPMEEVIPLEGWQNETHQSETEDHSENLNAMAGEGLMDESAEDQYSGESSDVLALQENFSREFRNGAPLCNVEEQNPEKGHHSEWQQGRLASDGGDDSAGGERGSSHQMAFAFENTAAEKRPHAATKYFENAYSKVNVTHKQLFMCSWCGKSFLWKSHLIAHERIHTGEKPFVCEECGQRFRWRSQWSEHQRCHTGEKTHSCTECGDRFHHSSALLKHQMIHTLENSPPCSDSEHSSIDYLNLPEHLKTYTSKKPFQCAECGKSYKLHDSLVIHQKRSHTGEKPYTCPKCEMSFAKRHLFRMHYKMHKRDLPYQCAHCEKTFKGRLSFLKHQRIHAEEMLQSHQQTMVTLPNEESVRVMEWVAELSSDEANTRSGAVPPGEHLVNSDNLQEQSDTYSVKVEHCETSLQYTDEKSQRSEEVPHLKMRLFRSKQIQGDGRGNHSGSVARFSHPAVLTVPQRIPVDGLHTSTGYKKGCNEIQAAGETHTFVEFKGTDNRQQHIESEGSAKGEEHGKVIGKHPEFPLRIIQVEDLDTGSDCEETLVTESTRKGKQMVYKGGGPFICNGCGKSFRWRSHFIAHERIHTGEKPFVCSECGKSFRWSSQWIDHQRSHTGERTQVCTECGESFHHGYALQKHQKIHSMGNMSKCLGTEQGSDVSHYVEDPVALAREKPHACTDCGKRYKLLDSLVIHRRRVHTGERPYICTKCEKSFTRRDQLRAHYRMHRAERPVPCTQCGKYFKGKTKLIEHLRTHAKEVSKPAPSIQDVLPEGENRESEERPKELCVDERQEHLKTKKRKGGEVMERKVYPKRHIQQKPQEILSGEINSVTQSYERNTKYRSLCNLERQPEVPGADDQNEGSERPKLPEDEKSSLRSQILTEYWRSVPKKVSRKPWRYRPGSASYICSGCGKNFRWRSHLIAHERIHTGEKPFVCSECGRSFRWSSQWIEHQRSHTGEKPYACMVCGKRYSRSCDLSSHKRVHTGERPYKCVCGKTFIAKKRLLMHQKIHVGERKHACTECGESFHHSYALLKHQRIHTRGNASQFSEREHSSVDRRVTEQIGTLPYVCIECGKSFKILESLIIHQRRSHTGERPYSCTKCEKSFIRRDQLRTHYKMHQKDQSLPYVQDGQSSRDRYPRLSKQQGIYQAQAIASASVTFHAEGRLELKLHQDPTSLAGDGFIDKVEENNLGECTMKLEPLKPSTDFPDASMRGNETGDRLQYPETQKGQNVAIKCEEDFSEQPILPQKNVGEIPHIKTENDQPAADQTSAGDGPPFICSGCGKIFQWRSHFIAHERIHTGEKPFTCAECGVSFRWSSQWHDHQKSHIGAKLYACMECGKSYSQSSDLAIHKRSHFGEHLYTCNDCGRSFSLKQRLIVHQRSHTRKKY